MKNNYNGEDCIHLQTTDITPCNGPESDSIYSHYCDFHCKQVIYPYVTCAKCENYTYKHEV